MISYGAAFLISLILAVVLTPVVRKYSFKVGLFDTPDDRKLHKKVIPRTGGLVIVFAFLAPIIGIALTNASVGMYVYQKLNFMFGIIVGSLLIMLVGLLDDIKGLGAKKKLLLQIMIASFAYFMGFKIQGISLPWGGSIEMGFFSYFITVIWIVGIINAFNLIDGMDGLAAGIGFFVVLLNFFFGYTSDNILFSLISVCLGGALVGFLFYNFNPASIFMGDAGSMFLGYILAIGAINSGQKTSTTVALLTPIIAMGIPIMDTLFSIARRFLERRPIFSPDRGHIHHKLVSLGLSQRRTVIILYGFTILLIAIALILKIGQNWQIGIAFTVFVLAFVIFAKIVGIFNYFHSKTNNNICYSYHSELLRKIVSRAILKAEQINDIESFNDYLSWFCKTIDIRFIDLYVNGDKEPKFSYENSDYPIDKRKQLMVTSMNLLNPAKKIIGYIKYGWHSERGRVTPQSEVLLLVITDKISEKIFEYKLFDIKPIYINPELIEYQKTGRVSGIISKLTSIMHILD